MDRFFEKISFMQFKKDIVDDFEKYDSYILPKRSSKGSAGYDFFAINDIKINPGKIIKVPTGYKVKMRNNEILMLFVRSSMGFKYNVRLCNQVGIIDSDYYGNESNEGHIFVALQNEGNETVIIKKNQAYVQGVFSRFLIADNDNTYNEDRKGGLGSTDIV